MRARIPRAFLEDEAAAYQRRRKAETPAQKATRHRAQDPVWSVRSAKADEHYAATRRGFMSHLGQLVPDYSIVCAWCLCRGLPSPSAWSWEKRLVFLERLAEGAVPEIHDPTTDTRRGDRSPAQFRADWLAACPSSRRSAA